MASRGLARYTPVWVGLLSAALSLNCTTVSFISPYDETTDRDVTALKSQVDSLVVNLQRQPMPTRDQLSGSYDALRERLDRMRFRNEARPKNSLTVRQLGEFQAELDSLDALHVTGRLNRAMVAPVGSIMSQTLRAILALELSKKELTTKE